MLLHLASNLFIFVLVLFSFVVLYSKFFALSTICSRFYSQFVHFRRIVCFYSFVLSVLAIIRTQGHILGPYFPLRFSIFHKSSVLCAFRCRTFSETDQPECHKRQHCRNKHTRIGKAHVAVVFLAVDRSGVHNRRCIDEHRRRTLHSLHPQQTAGRQRDIRRSQ